MMTLQENLEKLNFSRLEAQIYMALLGAEPQSAYQLAKKIEIARPSIYNALEHMLEKGMVEMVPDKTALYAAQEPDVLLGRLRQELTQSLDAATGQMEQWKENRREVQHLLFRGFSTAVFRAKKLLQEAQAEVYLNADFDLTCFAEELGRLRERGIRVIVFSFYDIEVPAGVEFYSHHRKMGEGHAASRLMLAVDNRISLVADGSGSETEWSGTVSNNALSVKILTEHIHNDIYLLKLRDKYGREMYGDDLWLHTPFEARGSL